MKLRTANVQQVVSDKLFWIGADAKNRILVAIDDAAAPAGIVKVKKGQSVQVEGTVARVPEQDVIKDRWKVKQPAKVVGDQTVYVKATRVGPGGPA